ncbi:hypothetical protein Lal_00027563 [Lupinus albus]|nr:hypothetical protein Lal_00027563 [Lupinus albus]
MKNDLAISSSPLFKQSLYNVTLYLSYPLLIISFPSLCFALHMSHTHFTKWGGYNLSSLHSTSFGSACIQLTKREEGYTFCMKMSSLALMKMCMCFGQY